MPDFTLKINGVTINRAAAGVRLANLTISSDSAGSLDFIEVNCSGSRAPTYALGSEVELEIDFGAGAARHFLGDIVSASRQFSPDKGSWAISYRCMDLRRRLDQVPLKTAGGRTYYKFNMSRTEPDYAPALVGLTVGDIAKVILDDHAAPLAAAGVTETFPIDGSASALETALDALDWTPPDAVEIRGERLWEELENFLQEQAPNHRLIARPDGSLALIDLTAGDEITWDEESDPIGAPNWSASIENCATRVLILGDDEIEGLACSEAKGDLIEGFTGTDKTNWDIADFKQPATARSGVAGTCSCSSTVVTFDPTDNALTWGSNDFAPNASEGYIEVRSVDVGVAGTIEETAGRFVTANTSLTAGGTSDITVDPPLPNTTYTQATLYSLAGGLSHVWRKYTLASRLAGRGRPAFPDRVAFTYAANSAAIATDAPMGFVQYDGGSGISMPIIFDYANDTVWFQQPVVTINNTTSDLEAGGASVTAPDDVIAFLPISKGAISAEYPPDSGGLPVYSGSAFDDATLERTREIYLRGWNDRRAVERVRRYAEELHKTLKDTQISGSVTYDGLHEGALTLGKRLNITAGYATGLETAALPIREVSVAFQGDAGTSPYQMSVSFSNDRRPNSGSRQHLTGLTRGQFDGWFGAGTALMQMGDQPGAALFGPISVMGAPSAQQLALGGIAQAQGLALGGIAGMQGQALGGISDAQGMALGSIADAQGFALGMGEEMSGLALNQMGLPRDYFQQGMATAAGIGRQMMGAASLARPLPRREAISGKDYRPPSESSFAPQAGVSGSMAGAGVASAGAFGPFGAIAAATASDLGAAGFSQAFDSAPLTRAQKARGLAAERSRDNRLAGERRRAEVGKQAAANRQSKRTKAASNTRKSWDRELARSRNAFNNAFMPNISRNGAVAGDAFTYWREDGQDADELITEWSPNRRGEITASGFSNGFDSRTASGPQQFDPRVVEIGRQYDLSRMFSTPRRIKEMNALTGRLKQINKERQIQELLSSPAILAGLGL